VGLVNSIRVKRKKLFRRRVLVNRKMEKELEPGVFQMKQKKKPTKHLTGGGKEGVPRRHRLNLDRGVIGIWQSKSENTGH